VIAITSLDVAFISAMAAVAAAIAAPASAWLVATANNKHDRWVKMYGDLRDAYVGVLREIIAARAGILLLARAYETDDPSIYVTPPAEDEASRIGSLAAVKSIASHRVYDAIDKWEVAWREHVTRVFEHLGHATPEERLKSAATMRESLKAVEEPWTRLCEAIRDDLRHQ